MGRKKQSNKTAVIYIRVTPEFRREVDKKAALEGRTSSSWVRQRLAEALDR